MTEGGDLNPCTSIRCCSLAVAGSQFSEVQGGGLEPHSRVRPCKSPVSDVICISEGYKPASQTPFFFARFFTLHIDMSVEYNCSTSSGSRSVSNRLVCELISFQIYGDNMGLRYLFSI